ncbi:hypothetical protein RJ641_001662 [Dillenia turbinata]|uniref:Uncharacterized protein n=1 Tax=Dillenia turbinata TaxID=194707 RepID=A0AAN8VQJ1_9MAGN
MPMLKLCGTLLMMGLRTSLCLQFKPHHIAAGAIFLAAKFLNVKLPSNGGRNLMSLHNNWRILSCSCYFLAEVSSQMLELYEQNRVPPSQSREMEGSSGVQPNHKASGKAPSEEPQLLMVMRKHKQESETSKQLRHYPVDDLGMPKANQNTGNENGITEVVSVITDHQVEVEVGYNPNQKLFPKKGIAREGPNSRNFV